MSLTLEVIGYKGVVGGATYKWLKTIGNEEVNVIGRDLGDTINVPVKDTVISYVCVPEAVAVEVCKEIDYADLIVIRSTIPPGTCKEVQRVTGIHTCHMPEFLVEATALIDEFQQEYLILGACCEEHANALKGMYDPYMPLVITDTETSEILKLTKNSYLATLISFWNEIENIAYIAGTNGHRIGNLATLDNRIVPYGARYHHKYGGKCLPKDIAQLREYAKQQGIKTPLLDAVVEVNNCQEL